MEMLFIPVEYNRKLEYEFLDEILKSVKEEKIGIFTTVQFLKQMQEVKEFLEDNGKKVFIGNPNFRASKPGQVLGCDVTAPLDIDHNVECFLYLGSGIFHQLNLAIQTEKTIYQANPITETITTLNEEDVKKYKRMKAESIGKVKQAKKIGILITTKPGQNQMPLAKKLKEKLENEGKKVYLFLFETLVPEEMYNFSDVEAWVNTACQRIALDDLERFPKPICNAEDLI